MTSKRFDSKKLLASLRENIFIEAFFEFVVVFVLTNLPFGCLALSYYLSTKGAVISWGVVASVIADNWKPGEILILVSALLAPISYLMIGFHRARRHMVGYAFLLIVIILMYCSSSYIFAYDRLKEVKNEDFIRTSSIALYLLATVI